MSTAIPLRLPLDLAAAIDGIWKDEHKLNGMSRSQLIRMLLTDAVKMWNQHR